MAKKSKYIFDNGGNPNEESVKNFYNNWVNSPMYKNMIQGKQDFSNERVNNINTLQPISYIPQNKLPTDEGKAPLGVYDVNKNAITLANNQIGKDRILSHEMGHSFYNGTNYIPKEDLTIMNPNNNLSQQQLAEIAADKQAVRFMSKKQGIYDPYTQEMTPDIMKKLNNNQNMERLKQYYNPEQMLKLFNETSSNNIKTDNTQAKYGGRIKKRKYQIGGEQDDYGSTDVFSNYVDQLAQQQNSQPQYEDDQSHQQSNNSGDDDYIKNLQSYADEQDQKDTYQKGFDDLKGYFDEQIQKLTDQIQVNNYLSSPEGQDDTEQQYDTRNLTPTIGDGGTYGNNAGNIRDTTTGQFKKYSTPQQGRDALVNQLNIYKTDKSHTGVKSTSTLYEAMAKYAPASDHNDPKGYAEFIAKHLGINPNTPINQIDSNKWADAITVMEGK